jgi:hypothetical protein
VIGTKILNLLYRYECIGQTVTPVLRCNESTLMGEQVADVPRQFTLTAIDVSEYFM